MSSILTNNSAMVALETLRNINSNLETVQNEISTGKKVGSAKDNAAIWAISTVMSTDVESFKQIGDALDLGSSTVGVARAAAEQVTETLQDMKELIVSAQQENVDRSKIQTDIQALRDQISTVVGSAQFNGLNMVQGTDQVNILSSLDRDSAGNVSPSYITADRQDLTTAAGTFGGGTSLNPNATVSDTGTGALNDDGNTAVITMNTSGDYSGASGTFSVGGVTVSFAAGELGTGDQDAAAGILAGRINALGIEGITASAAGADVTITSTRAFEGADVAVSGLGGNAAGTQITALNGTGSLTVASGTIDERAENVTFDTAAAVNDGDGYRITFDGKQFTYVAGAGETMEDVARGLKAAIDAEGVDGISTQVTQDGAGAWQVKIDNDSTTTMTLAAIGNADGEASGGLFGLDGIDVSTAAGASAALDNIETMLQRSIDAAASFGSVQKRIEGQTEFVNTLVDSLTMGVSGLTDADIEAASAKLQALQVQQQLGVQALSIANSAPQTLLSLFR